MRLRFFKKYFCGGISIGLFLTLAPARSGAPEQNQLPPLLKQVEDKYTRAATLMASFDETTESAAMKTTKKSSGVLEFKRPGKVRWETLKPDRNLLIGDGSRFWYYTPPFDEGDSGQYSVKDASKVQSKFAQLLLSASFSTMEASRSMQMRAVQTNEFSLIPKKGTAGSVKEAHIVVDPVNKFITEVRLTHRDGNTTRITLKDIQLGTKLDDQHFRFTPPPNTEKLED